MTDVAEEHTARCAICDTKSPGLAQLIRYIENKNSFQRSRAPKNPGRDFHETVARGPFCSTLQGRSNKAMNA